MSYNSPWIDPQQYISKVNNLSSEGIALDDGIARVVREAAYFSSKYSSNFSLVSELKVLDEFSERWTKALYDSRDAASSVSGWLNRFDQVYLDMINIIGSQQDAKDVITEFNAFINEESPSGKYNLDGVPGPKDAFRTIEGLAIQESKHVISVLEGADWAKAVETGVRDVRNALNNYATKLAREAAAGPKFTGFRSKSLKIYPFRPAQKGTVGKVNWLYPAGLMQPPECHPSVVQLSFP
ncbi:hypothetical protein EST38_g9664 [Candolleomyces aberdarensis]|uniref:Uncharacterized protein n=1 Tax=Candolleomyces aberdarensis TaxID=2316362 RepID=A0A4Q2DA18_9AGAR|nr:hypothetical protein EST38_g9664 [Candolleomyces aberdarensis]